MNYTLKTTTPKQGVLQQRLNFTYPGSPAEYEVLTPYEATSIHTAITVTTVMEIQNVDGVHVPLTSTALFQLTKATYPRIKFTYKTAGDSVAGFLVNDSDLPFGYVVDATVTTCPTTSRNGNTTGVSLTSTGCVAAYNYLPPTSSSALFYTAATQAPSTSLPAPKYSLKDGASLKVFTPPTTVTAQLTNMSKFANLTATVEHTELINGLRHVTVKFTATAVPVGQRVSITPNLPITGISTYGSPTCMIVVGSDSCTIEFVRSTAGAPIVVPYVYASTISPEYNAVNATLNITSTGGI